jgi:hypothetical protein
LAGVAEGHVGLRRACGGIGRRSCDQIAGAFDHVNSDDAHWRDCGDAADELVRRGAHGLLYVGGGNSLEGAEYDHAGPVWTRTEEKTRSWISFRTGATAMDEVSGGEAIECTALNESDGYGVTIEGEGGVMNFF